MALLSTITGILGSAADAFGSLFAANKNRKFQQYLQNDSQEFTREEREAMQGYQTNERLAAQEYNTSEREAAQQWELDQWNRTNAYNSPSAQLARMTAAGINPNAAFGGMSSVAAQPLNTAGATISPQSAASGESGVGATPLPFPNFLEGIAEGVNNSFRNALTSAQIGKTEAETRVTEEQVKQVIADTAKSDAEAKQLNALTPLFVGKTEKEIDSILSAINLAKQQYETEKQRTTNEQKQGAVIDAQRDLTRAQESNVNEQTNAQMLQNICDGAVAALAEQGIIVNQGSIIAGITAAGSSLVKLYDKVKQHFGFSSNKHSNLNKYDPYNRSLKKRR